MVFKNTYDSDLRVVAFAYIKQREAGSLDHPAFLAAIDAYQVQHPETTNGEAAMIVGELMQDIPRATCY